MNLNQIEIKNFILALFKRDDGERFLLGAGAYEFNERLQHFQPNIIANDIVEKQGTDGQLLAGQVLRSATQNFDGYIGDATMTRIDTETARRNFVRFFQTNHHYTVIYILPDGSAIQRQGGYLVDAPSVPENDQRFPEYHVALAFENVHYYSYAENPDGSETYASIWSIEPTGVLTGGLVWDNIGVEWTGQGATLNAIKGATFQQTYTGKNLLDINVVYPAGTTQTGMGGSVTATFNSDGSITLDGTQSTSNISLTGGNNDLIIPVDSSKPYKFVIEYQSGSMSPTTNTVLAYDCRYNNGASVYYRNVPLDGTSGAQAIDVTGTEYITRVRIYRNTANHGNATFDDLKIRIALYESTESDTWEPYVGGVPAPNPSYPQGIQTATGTQSITINGTSYPLDLGTIELCKLSTYQDYIWNDGGTWKIHKETYKRIFDGAGDTWNYNASTHAVQDQNFNVAQTGAVKFDVPGVAVCDMFGYYPSSGSILVNIPNNSFGFQNSGSYFASFRNDADFTSKDAAIAWIRANKPTAYWALATPTDTAITDAALIAELDAIEAAMEADGPVTIIPTGTNLAAVIDATPNDQGGAIWEDQGGTSYTEVVNAGLATASPIWTVDGYADAPSITNETTGQTLSFSGTVPAGQTLIVDCGAQTAYIEGVDVKNQISGQWPEIRPGANLISYTGADVSTNCELKWNEVIE